jgi:hypothetical protein
LGQYFRYLSLNFDTDCDEAILLGILQAKIPMDKATKLTYHGPFPSKDLSEPSTSGKRYIEVESTWHFVHLVRGLLPSERKVAFGRFYFYQAVSKAVRPGEKRSSRKQRLRVIAQLWEILENGSTELSPDESTCNKLKLDIHPCETSVIFFSGSSPIVA